MLTTKMVCSCPQNTAVDEESWCKDESNHIIVVVITKLNQYKYKNEIIVH